MTAAVIGLGGKLRAGKDEVADYLVERHGFQKLGMSDALHEALLAIDPILGVEYIETEESVTGHVWKYSEAIEEFGYVDTKKRFSEARRLLQNLGTEVGREMIGENTWVNIMARKIDDNLYADRPVVVTGVRFPNELTLIHQFAGRAVWVDRPSLYATPASTHASENGVTGDLFDTVIVNDGTLEDLYRKAAQLVELQ